MLRLSRRTRLFDMMPVDRLHHAHAREDHRAIVLRGLIGEVLDYDPDSVPVQVFVERIARAILAQLPPRS
jgi:hypothetical protein